MFDPLVGGAASPPAPEERPPIAPTPEALRALRDAIARGDHQGAIDAAISAFGLSSGALWDPALDQEGDTDGQTRVITIGPPAFVDPKTGHARSLGWLVSSLAHECIHLHQLCAVHPVDGGDNYARAITVGNDANEAQAYDWEIRNAAVLGLTAAEQAELVGRREEHGRALAQHPYYAARIGLVPGGRDNDYWIDPADR
jgi:hypothetical protein